MYLNGGPTINDYAISYLMHVTLIMVVNAQSLRNITVDDTDPSVSYQGNWGNTAGADSTYASYGGSHRYTTEVGASVTFTFTGKYLVHLINI